MHIIYSYRIEQAMTINRPGNTSMRENEIMICKKLRCAVNIHRKALGLIVIEPYKNKHTLDTDKTR